MSTKAFNRVHLSYRPHPLRFYRPTRLALLFDVDPSTIWRWEQTECCRRLSTSARVLGV